MPNHATEQTAYESFEIAYPEDSEHIDPLEHWQLDDFQDLLD